MSLRISLILLIEGFVSISLQMIALRQLVPFVGSSTVTTSIVITGFLAALALGYKRGGVAISDPGEKLKRNLLGAAILGGLGMSYFAAGSFFEITLSLLPSIFSVALYVLILVCPVVYLLAQSILLLMRYSKGTEAPASAGNTFNLSTWDNVAGGLITTLVVMYFLGVGWALVINTLLLGLGCCLLPGVRVETLAARFAGIGVLVWLVNVAFENSMFDETTVHANYKTVLMADGSTILDINNSNASKTNSQDVGHQYIEHFEKRAFSGSGALNPESILVLGAGGFTFGRGRELHNTKIHFVDVDSRLPAIGKEFLGVDEIPHQITISDARAFLLSTNETFDLIILDTFSHTTSMPSHLLTQEYFRLVRSRLAENGSIMLNIIMPKGMNTRFKRVFDNTIRSVFSDCRGKEITRPLIPVVNRIYECRVSGQDGVVEIYSDTDSRASVESSFR